MNIYTNDSLIKRNARIASLTMLSGFAVLVAGMVISFRRDPDPQMVTFSFGALILGFILSQIGIYFQNRWGRRPRPDEVLNRALKGLDSKYSIYHYKTPASHVLVGPSGVWALLPRNQRGEITFKDGRWRQKGKGFLHAYMRIFGQEGLGRPDLEVSSEIENLRQFLTKHLPEGTELPEIQAALVFTNPRAEINIDPNEAPPAETVPVDKLKDLCRKAAKGRSLSVTRVKQIQDTLSGK